MGGKVLVPTAEAVAKLNAARLAADVCGVPTVLLARTDADAANLITSDSDERDHPFITGERTPEGFYRTNPGMDQAIARGLAYAPYADLDLVRDVQAGSRTGAALRRRDPRRVPGSAAGLQLLAVVQLEGKPR